MRPSPLIASLLGAAMLAACAPANTPGSEPASAAIAEDASAPTAIEGTLTVQDGEVFVPPGERDVTAGFGIFSAGDRYLTLIGASAGFAQAIELHTHEMGEDGRMAMRQVSGFEIPAGGAHTLRRGGDHLMLFGIDREALQPGAELPVTFTVRFADGTTEDIVLSLTVKEL